MAGGPLSIGRHPENVIVLQHASVSIYHAEVFVENGRTLLRDLKSSNGTKVNSKRISEVALKEGDEIRFGPLEDLRSRSSVRPFSTKTSA